MAEEAVSEGPAFWSRPAGWLVCIMHACNTTCSVAAHPSSPRASITPATHSPSLSLVSALGAAAASRGVFGCIPESQFCSRYPRRKNTGHGALCPAPLRKFGTGARNCSRSHLIKVSVGHQALIKPCQCWDPAGRDLQSLVHVCFPLSAR
jgi:hypothetical protein